MTTFICQTCCILCKWIMMDVCLHTQQSTHAQCASHTFICHTCCILCKWIIHDGCLHTQQSTHAQCSSHTFICHTCCTLCKWIMMDVCLHTQQSTHAQCASHTFIKCHISVVFRYVVDSGKKHKVKHVEHDHTPTIHTLSFVTYVLYNTMDDT